MLAIIKTCQNIPCDGTNNADLLHERVNGRPDNIFGFDGRDLLDANNRREGIGCRADASDKLLANDVTTTTCSEVAGLRPLLR